MRPCDESSLAALLAACRASALRSACRASACWTACRAVEDLAFKATHPFCFARGALVVESEEVEQAVRNEYGKLGTHAMVVLSSLSAHDRKTEHEIAQKAYSPWSAHALLLKTQHVGRSAQAAVLEVQPRHFPLSHSADRENDAVTRAKAPFAGEHSKNPRADRSHGPCRGESTDGQQQRGSLCAPGRTYRPGFLRRPYRGRCFPSFHSFPPLHLNVPSRMRNTRGPLGVINSTPSPSKRFFVT